MEFIHDDPLPILESSVTFVGEWVVIVFMGWKCAVSADGGQTWHHWDAEVDLPEWRSEEEANYRYIDYILMKPDGRGTIVLNPIRWTRLRSLVTTDFGRTWIRTTPSGPGQTR